MKATGIVRRIDELGRVVIPKEIRRTLRIDNGDPLEIYTDKDEIILKKYSPVANIESVADDFTACFSSVDDCVCVITDTDKIISASGSKMSAEVGMPITQEFTKTIKQRKSVLLDSSTSQIIPVSKGYEYAFDSQIIVPILLSGDLVGAISVFRRDKENPLSSVDVKLCVLGAELLAKRFE